MDYHSFAGLVDFDGTVLSRNNGYCNNNSYNAAVINIEQTYGWRGRDYTMANVSAHEISHLYNTYDGRRQIPLDAGLELGNAYFHGNVAGDAIEDNCELYVNEGTVSFCYELSDILQEQ